MSFSKTVPQMRNRTKTVTRRFDWPFLQPGTRLLAIEKGMGLPAGAKQVPLGVIEVLDVRREPLGEITADDVVREGFPGMTTEWFVAKLGGDHGRLVRRIEFVHIGILSVSPSAVAEPELPMPIVIAWGLKRHHRLTLARVGADWGPCKGVRRSSLGLLQREHGLVENRLLQWRLTPSGWSVKALLGAMAPLRTELME